MEVSSAIAQIPEQSNPISGSGNMLLPMSEHRVANAVFERAMLEIIINWIRSSIIPSIVMNGSLNAKKD